MKRFWGKYPGEVADNLDPLELGRLRAYVPDVGFVEHMTDWAALCASPWGGKDDLGEIIVPDIGMNVWMEFIGGDVNRPIWSGIYYSRPNARNEVPEEARGIGESGRTKGVDRAVAADGTLIREPEDPSAPTYPKNKVFKTGNWLIEYDDTPGAERLNIFHLASGTYREISPDGSFAEAVKGEHFMSVDADQQIHVKGDRHVVVDGKCTFKSLGDMDFEVGGNLTFIVGGEKLTVAQDLITQISSTGTLVISGNNHHF